jgi:fructan beta-fructosidase
MGTIPLTVPALIECTIDQLHAFFFVFNNNDGESVTVGYNEELNAFYIDRSKAGKSDFHKGFAAIHYGSRIATTSASKITILLDNSSLELFADNGLTTITDVFFPSQPLTNLQPTLNRLLLQNIKISALKSIWP